MWTKVAVVVAAMVKVIDAALLAATKVVAMVGRWLWWQRRW